ncbi:MAG TPA: DUF1800 family protein [Tepidisphaeraceae bacterium]|jgi:uncharacterized protein (DUF1800 family)|nr:DUF1800 family protein [Tepidisphaeraceae bacterium]
MPPKRQQPPRLGLAITVFSLLLIVSGSVFAADDWSRDDAAHLLRRAGFGGTPTQIDQIHAMGRDAAVDYLITGKLPDKAQAPFAHVELSPFVLDPDFNYRVQGAGSQYELQSLRAWLLNRMVQSDRPLEEKMVLFWHGVFTSGYQEVRNVGWLADQDALLHREAIGNYKRLTREMIHDPAMIKYLNNDDNQKGRPNENLAREMMELFTMGEGNGYTEKDVPEVARALTGLTVRRGFGRSQLVERLHDNGSKTIFRKTGNYGPDDVVDLIFARPEPASYLAKRLWQFFGTSDPSTADIAAVADALQKNNWDVAPALKVMFTSQSFYSSQEKFVLIKSPAELEVMTLRLLDEPTPQRLMTATAGSMRQLGQELFQPPNVKGWPGGEHWITSTAIFARYNIASAMANGVLGANFGRFRGNRGPAAAARAKAAAAQLAAGKTPATQPSAGATAVATANARPRFDPSLTPAQRQAAQKARLDEIRKEEREKVQAKLAELPPMPPADEMVVPTKLFAQLGKEPSTEQLVDAAIDRFIQHPLPADKRATLLDSMGKQPLKLGEASSDRRVRQLIGVLLSTPEYQVE